MQVRTKYERRGKTCMEVQVRKTIVPEVQITGVILLLIGEGLDTKS